MQALTRMMALALLTAVLVCSCSQNAKPSTTATVSPSGGPLPPLPVVCAFFDEVQDSMDEPEDAMGLDPVSTAAILETLKNCTAEYLRENSDKTLTFKKLMTDPKPCRGHAMTVSGVLKFQDKLKIPAAIKGAPPAMYQGILANGKQELYTFLSLEPIPAEIKEGTGVRVSGIFLKRFAFVNRMAGEMATWAPLLFVCKVEKYSELEALK